MTIEDYLQSARAHAKKSDLRLGQCLFNSLYEVRPDLADRVRASEADPFYKQDWELSLFFDFIYNNW